MQDTIFVLQEWSGRLEQWQSQGRIESEDFAEACRQLHEAGLWQWASEAAGHAMGPSQPMVKDEEYQAEG